MNMLDRFKQYVLKCGVRRRVGGIPSRVGTFPLFYFLTKLNCDFSLYQRVILDQVRLYYFWLVYLADKCAEIFCAGSYRQSSFDDCGRQLMIACSRDLKIKFEQPPSSPYQLNVAAKLYLCINNPILFTFDHYLIPTTHKIPMQPDTATSAKTKEIIQQINIKYY